MEEALTKLLNNVAELFKVKSIVTLTVTTAITVGFLNGKVPVELYATYVGSIITYYFTRKEDKND